MITMKIPIVLVSILLLIAISSCSAIDPPKQFLRGGNNNDNNDDGDDLRKRQNKKKANGPRRFLAAAAGAKNGSSDTSSFESASLSADPVLPTAGKDDRSSTTNVVTSRRASKAFTDTAIVERRQLDQKEEEGIVEDLGNNPVQSDLFFDTIDFFFDIFDSTFSDTVLLFIVWPILIYFLILVTPILLPVAIPFFFLLSASGIFGNEFGNPVDNIFLVSIIYGPLIFILWPFLVVLAPPIYILYLIILLFLSIFDDEDRRMLLDTNIMKQLKDDIVLSQEGMEKGEHNKVTDLFFGLFYPDLLANLIDILELPI